jgi:hypothetical protein
VEGCDAGAIIRYSDGAALPLRNRARGTGKAARSLLGLMEDRPGTTAATRRDRGWAAPPPQEGFAG